MRLIPTIIFMSAITFFAYNPVQAHHRAVPFTSPFTSYGNQPVVVNDFKCVRNEDRVELSWLLLNNESADRLIVQRSYNGKKFEMAGLVFSSDKSEKEIYRFFETNKNRKVFYRIIIVHKDKTVTYSPVVRMASEKKGRS